MSRYNYFFPLSVVLGALLIGLSVYSCANKGYPEGGPKDTTAPKVIAEQPVSFSKNFNKKDIRIYFDEYVQLKEVNEKFIISPPQSKKPKVNLRGKYILVQILDSLRPETTYSLDFADAILDNNEGNPLGFYRYVFSTGNTIDTLELSGNVVDAESDEPVLNAYVFLYENHADSVPLLQLPNYMARTDSSGFFRVTNLRDAEYRILAVKDDNRDYKYTPEAEQVAFWDSLVRPVVIPMVRTDTVGVDSLGRDSVVTRQYLAYGPSNLYLRMFVETPTQLYMVDEARKQRQLLSFIFSIPGENNLQLQLLDTLVEGEWYLPEISAGKDTINLWITDSMIYKRDTLRLKLDYLRSDSTRKLVPYTDTIRLLFSDKKKGESSKRKKKEEKPVIEFLRMDVKVAQEQDINRGLPLEFDRPIREEDLVNLHLSEKADTIYRPVEIKIRKDSLKLRQYTLEADWKPENEYLLTADSATIYDIYGRHNNKLEKKFRARALESYGKLIVDLKGVEGQILLQLYKPDNKKTEDGRKIFDIVAEKIVEGNKQVEFDFLNEGKYRLRAILDKNRNGEWDTGLYLQKIQPEEVKYLPKEVNIKQNFDIEEEFDLKLPYKEKIETNNK